MPQVHSQQVSKTHSSCSALDRQAQGWFELFRMFAVFLCCALSTQCVFKVDASKTSTCCARVLVQLRPRQSQCDGCRPQWSKSALLAVNHMLYSILGDATCQRFLPAAIHTCPHGQKFVLFNTQSKEHFVMSAFFSCICQTWSLKHRTRGWMNRAAILAKPFVAQR
eukprot:2921674-Amphidinium_carterae.1